MNIKEILDITQEECAEAIQAISKISRFGLYSEWQGRTNQERLEEEIGDVLAMIKLLTETNIVRDTQLQKAADCKLEKLKKWSQIFDPEVLDAYNNERLVSRYDKQHETAIVNKNVDKFEEFAQQWQLFITHKITLAEWCAYCKSNFDDNK